MEILATLVKATKTGGQVTWDFVKKDDGTFAAVRREPKEKLASNEADLRSIYKAYLGYGFSKTEA